MAKCRLDKYLATAGFGTRSEVKDLLKKGKVSVNGDVCKKPETKVDPDEDDITCNDRQVVYEKHVWGMLHKPAGCVTATKDHINKTVMDYLPEDFKNRKGVFPVGRLDIDTEGLLLFTDDGEAAHFLLAPGKHVDKTYYARLDGDVSEEMLEKLRCGVDIGDEKPTLPCEVTCAENETDAVYITICEGRYHQIKRMFQAVGRSVVYLKRLSMGAVKLDDQLPKGSFRALTKEEVGKLTNR